MEADSGGPGAPRVSALELRAFRNLELAALELADGVTLLAGPNGAGKTNVLEGLYMSLAGRSPRTRSEREAIAFGAPAGRCEAVVTDGEERHLFRCAIVRAEGRFHQVDSRPAGPADAELRPAICVFMPDRLALIKGPPAARRSHLDRFAAALWPARAEIRRRYARALSQRNALLARAAGQAPPSLEAWDRELAEAGVELIALRAATVDLLIPRFAQAASELGLSESAELDYRPRSSAREAEELVAELAERRGSDLGRGYSGHGPHLDELGFALGGRLARRYASQGQQRLSLLSLLFAERAVLTERRGRPPLMLLDDVTSELDTERRGHLGARLTADGGQSLITSTDSSDLPANVARTEIEVRDGALLGPGARA
ncbi:MAG: DNA replication and repair protein RecF [Solirubrobacterales bacterium]|nr:DNA replication and repair protein RecF [Solirubrobacterales bacterium]